MLRTRTLVGLVLATACIVFAIGMPWLLEKRRTPAKYVANQVATTAEIQEFDLMWAELESLQRQSAELGPPQFKQQFLASTTDYLQLDAEQTQKFIDVVDSELASLEDARDRHFVTRRQTIERQGDSLDSQPDSWTGEGPTSTAARRDAWSQWRDDQRTASDRLLSVLQPIPRHDLLAERRLLWILKLDYSLRDSRQTMLAESNTMLTN